MVSRSLSPSFSHPPKSEDQTGHQTPLCKRSGTSQPHRPQIPGRDSDTKDKPKGSAIPRNTSIHLLTRAHIWHMRRATSLFTSSQTPGSDSDLLTPYSNVYNDEWVRFFYHSMLRVNNTSEPHSRNSFFPLKHSCSSLSIEKRNSWTIHKVTKN